MIVLPVYLVVDVSASLTSEIGLINNAVTSLIHAAAANPATADKVRLSLIVFSDQARTVIPLSDPSEIPRVPSLIAGGATNYSAAFSLVRQLVPADVARLKSEGIGVLRPVMFFVTDGSPVDQTWQAAVGELRRHEFRERPTIVAIGFGSADPTILREIGDGGAFMISDAFSAPDAISSIWSSLTRMLAATAINSTSVERNEQVEVGIPPEWFDLR